MFYSLQLLMKLTFSYLQHLDSLSSLYEKLLMSWAGYMAVSCVKRCKCTNGTETDCGSTVRVLTSLKTQPFYNIHCDRS